MRYILIVAVAMLTGCSTTNILDKEAFATKESEKPRQAIVDCLLNRTPGQFQAKLDESPDRSYVSWDTGVATYWGFVVRDQGSGSITEFKRANSIYGSGPSVIDTCF